MKSNTLIKKGTSKLVSLHPNKEYLYIWQMYGSFFKMSLINHSVHLGLCIASVFWVSNLFKLWQVFVTCLVEDLRYLLYTLIHETWHLSVKITFEIRYKSNMLKDTTWKLKTSECLSVTAFENLSRIVSSCHF
jgi:hypothetical protein